jgi:tight adherence protein B
MRVSGGAAFSGPFRGAVSARAEHRSAGSVTASKFSRDDAAELCGRVAALSRAGLPAVRVWQVLADSPGRTAEAAAAVAGMLGVGGSTADGLRLAAGRLSGPGIEALNWLAVASEVIDRSGAPAALVLDEVASGLLAQLAEADEREVALAGPRATASVLSLLPLVGMALGALIGVNVPAVLLGTPAGRLCAVGGALLWGTGRAWSSRLVRSAGRVRG